MRKFAALAAATCALSACSLFRPANYTPDNEPTLRTLAVRKIDVDQFEGIWERFNFKGIPAMLLFKDGQEIHRVIGFGGQALVVLRWVPDDPSG